MKLIKIYDLLHKRVLVTRLSARSIERELAGALEEGHGEITLDFAGTDGMTPSFLDEVLSVLEEYLDEETNKGLRVTVANPPTRLSSKFAAVGRGHDLSIEESDSGVWTICRKRGAS